jgi:hypothetical protein
LPLLDRFPFRLRLRLASIDARALLVAVALLGGCTPEIGDKCVLSTDCSTRGDRLCDTSQPDGYCTQFNCSKNSCPDDAACILFNAAVPGCGYDDRAGKYGSRVARSFCVAMCTSDGDCRPGYICGDPTAAPWNGLITDDDKSKRTCLVAPTALADGGVDGGADAALFTPNPAPVCGPVAPDVKPIDASAPRIDDGGATLPPLVPDGGAADAGDAGDAGDGGDAGAGG